MKGIDEALANAKSRLFFLEDGDQGSEKEIAEAKKRIELYEYMIQLPEDAKYWLADTQIFREIMEGYVKWVFECYVNDSDSEIAEAAQMVRSRVLNEMLKITVSVGAKEAEECYTSDKSL